MKKIFRLISGFNDIFVMIASGLLLVSVAWLGTTIEPWLGLWLARQYLGVWLNFLFVSGRMAFTRYWAVINIF